MEALQVKTCSSYLFDFGQAVQKEIDAKVWMTIVARNFTLFDFILEFLETFVQFLEAEELLWPVK